MSGKRCNMLSLVWTLLVLVAVAVRKSHALSAPSTTVAKPVSAQDSASSGSDLAANVWRSVATCEPKEREDEVVTPTRPLPKDLCGTYYVNGLASCQVFDRMVHPFEAYGFLKAFHFSPDGVRMTAKYVQTPVRKLEQRFRRPLFRGAMSAIADSRTFGGRFCNALSPTTRETANLAITAWGDKLIASADNCDYFGMDAKTLETLGPESLDGALPAKGSKGREKMLAHTRIDSEKERLVTCSLEYLVPEKATKLVFSEFDKDGHLVSTKVHQQSPSIIFHDWMITPNYYVVPGADAIFDMGKLPDLMTGKSTATDIFTMDGQAPAQVTLIPRPGSKAKHDTSIRVQESQGRHGVVFHIGPCYEETNADGSTTVVMHPMVFDRYKFGGEMGFLLDEQEFDPTPWSESNGGPRVERWTAEIPSDVIPSSEDQDMMTIQMETTRLHDVKSDMPTFHPDRHGLSCRFMYTVCGIRPKGWFPFNSVAKHDLKTGATQVWPPEAAKAVDDPESWDGGVCVRSEPLFVPKVGWAEGKDAEDDGYVLSTTHNSETKQTTLDVFDAKSIDKGPISQIPLGELWGWNIHSCFDRRP